ncbi:hypothetical protein F5Y18DRAFT_378032 [Xylariaceae sp. FL1019]|nr:hypothetical protein F5Y18DRAFT_378032 [Xylariaceae sp. FL1019]
MLEQIDPTSRLCDRNVQTSRTSSCDRHATITMPVNPFKFGTGPWDESHRFQTSWLLPPYVLFGFRALFSLYILTTLLYNIGHSCASDACSTARTSFSYFTVLTYWGLFFYFLFSSIHTLSYAHHSSTPLQSWPRPLQALHSLLYTCTTVFPFVVTIVFWALLSSPTTLSTTYSAWSNISQHALNSFFALFEIVVPRTNLRPWVHIPFLLFILALYLALAYVTDATKGFYTYSFLDPGLQGGLVAAYVFGIAIGFCVVFSVVQGLIWVRRRITEGRGKGVGYRGADGDADREKEKNGSQDIPV